MRQKETQLLTTTCKHYRKHLDSCLLPRRCDICGSAWNVYKHKDDVDNVEEIYTKITTHAKTGGTKIEPWGTPLVSRGFKSQLTWSLWRSWLRTHPSVSARASSSGWTLGWWTLWTVSPRSETGKRGFELKQLFTEWEGLEVHLLQISIIWRKSSHVKTRCRLNRRINC